MEKKGFEMWDLLIYNYVIFYYNLVLMILIAWIIHPQYFKQELLFFRKVASYWARFARRQHSFHIFDGDTGGKDLLYIKCGQGAGQTCCMSNVAKVRGRLAVYQMWPRCGADLLCVKCGQGAGQTCCVSNVARVRSRLAVCPMWPGCGARRLLVSIISSLALNFRHRSKLENDADA